MSAAVVAVELAKAGEHLQRAALAIAALGPEHARTALAWTRQVDELLEQALELHAAERPRA